MAATPELWCERGDSNPYGFTRQILSLVRLPIPPLSHSTVLPTVRRPMSSATLRGSLSGHHKFRGNVRRLQCQAQAPGSKSSILQLIPKIAFAMVENKGGVSPCANGSRIRFGGCRKSDFSLPSSCYFCARSFVAPRAELAVISGCPIPSDYSLSLTPSLVYQTRSRAMRSTVDSCGRS